MSVRAELLADAGAAAAAKEFFRSREFMAAEGVTHTLRIGDLAGPVIVSGIPGAEESDASSPYGFPGLAGSAGGPIDPAEIDWSDTRLVSVFIRHLVGPQPPLAGSTLRNRVFLADPEKPRKSRASDRQQIRKNVKRGYEIRAVPGPEVGDDELAGFHAAYTETMRRAGASERYFYEPGYFRGCLGFPDSWLVIAAGPEGRIAAGSLLVRSDGLLHYFLSGTADEQLRDSPMKNVVSAICDLGEELGLAVNFGGGLSEGDALEEFKRGFANSEAEWHSSELICDPHAYERLSAGADAGEYFPAYRAG